MPGVTVGELRPELATIAVPNTDDRRNMTGDEFAVTAGWGHFSTGDAVCRAKAGPSSASELPPNSRPSATQRQLSVIPPSTSI